MKRWLVGGGLVVGVTAAFVLAVAVGMLVGAGGLSVGGGMTTVAGSAPTHTPAPAPAPTPPGPAPTPTSAPAPSGTPAVVGVDAEPPVALFVGDSYTVGQRASSPAKRWSTLVARELGWVERNVADGGTGFVSRNPDRGLLSYEEQLRSVREPRQIDVVVIAGGQNDFPELRETPAEVFRAVADTYELAARRFPDAQIVAVGPSTPWEIGLEARALDSAVRAAAERHDATYVSMIDPDVVPDRHVDADGVHVNDKGYGAIARRVVAQIS
ncbi:SGNH/GDSL hydrolase family protein [Promicromonospora vindobonensis]|uniref:SGNH/GDSL hydrolase family protein n=1 Tax=Promicromonospora vindobonensis TaxID=195748 RepID=A0ABW5VK23_9MICO